MNDEWIKFADCEFCKGRGWLIGGDEEHQCPWCRRREERRLREELTARG